MDPITILMEPGTNGPKGAPETATIEVTDWCSERFVDCGQTKGDGATMRSSANSEGYAVLRAHHHSPSKDGSAPEPHISPDLYYVEGETGNDLILLLVGRDGTARFSSDGVTIVRASQLLLR